MGTIVYASSIASYGAHADNPAVLTETCPLRPNDDWYYSRTKGQVEVLLDEIEARSPATVVVRLRPGVFLGETATNLVARALSSPVVPTLVDARFNLCWDEDVAEAFRLALHHGRSDVFNLTAGPALTLAECAGVLGRPVMRVPARLRRSVMWLGRAMGALTQGHDEWLKAILRGDIIASSERAKEHLGWRPRCDAHQTLLEFAGHSPAKEG